MPEGGLAYKETLLKAFCWDTNVCIKLTSYRSTWVPEDILNDPSKIEDKKAIFVFVDSRKPNIGEEQQLQFLYPIREVEIKNAVVRGDFLDLYLKPLGYLKCSDYQKYTLSLKEDLEILPPSEKSYIQFDRLRSLSSSESVDENTETWQKLVGTLVNTEPFKKTGFYRIIAIKTSDQKTVGLIDYTFEKRTNSKDIVLPVYSLIENHEYTLELEYNLPRHNEDGCGRIELKIEAPSWLHLNRDELDLFERDAAHKVEIKVVGRPISSKPEYIRIRPQKPEDTFYGNIPTVEIPVSMKNDWISRLSGFLKSKYQQLILLLSFMVVYFVLHSNFLSLPPAVVALADLIVITIIAALVQSLLKKTGQ